MVVSVGAGKIKVIAGSGMSVVVAVTDGEGDGVSVPEVVAVADDGVVVLVPAVWATAD